MLIKLDVYIATHLIKKHFLSWEVAMHGCCQAWEKLTVKLKH